MADYEQWSSVHIRQACSYKTSHLYYTFFYWCDKILDKGHFSGERASLGSQFEGAQSTMAEKVKVAEE